jgi:hypothetical protein
LLKCKNSLHPLICQGLFFIKNVQFFGISLGFSWYEISDRLYEK